MFREKKNESDRKNNELFLDYNMEKNLNLYLNHMPPAVEALGKMVILGLVKLQDRSGQCVTLIVSRPKAVCFQGWEQNGQSTDPCSESRITRAPKHGGRHSSAAGVQRGRRFFR